MSPQPKTTPSDQLPRMRTHPRSSIPVLALTLASATFLAASSHAGYRIDLVSDGLTTKTVRPGDSIALDVVLASDAQDRHVAASFRIACSVSGLRVDSYNWASPYVSGDLDDTSVPALKDLPTTITVDTASGNGFPAAVADIYFSNLIGTAATFAQGGLLRLNLTVPASFVGPDQITLQVIPDGFITGFAEVPARAGEAFQLRVSPASGAPASLLSIANSPEGMLLSWPAAATNVVLETTTDPATPSSWVVYSASPSSLGSRKQVLIENPSGQPAFFRLRFF